MRSRILTGRRLTASGLAALAGLFLATAASTASAGEGVVRVSDRQDGVVRISHSATACAAPCTPGGDCDGCTSGCRCGNGCQCGGCGHNGLLGKLFGGKNKNCRCGKNCQCGSGRNCDPVGSGYCSRCGRNGLLYGPGYCSGCCGVLGIPCCLPGIPVPGIPVPGCFAGTGAIGGTYGRVYALNPYYHDFRDGAVYAAQGYNAPIAVPLAPNVDYQMNYGWGIPSSRVTPISRVVPSPYAVAPTYAVPPGYVPAGSLAAQAADDKAEEKGSEKSDKKD